MVGKLIDGAPESQAKAEQAFRRALELNDRLSVAHKLFANLEADAGQSQRAVVRLVREAGRNGNDPEPFVGLVHALRYCGLYDESITAHAEARRLDPHASTTIALTRLMAGELEPRTRVGPESDDDRFTRIMCLGFSGRRDEARALLPDVSQVARIPVHRIRTEFLAAWLDRRPMNMFRALTALSAFTVHDDPEGIFQSGWMLCDVAEYEQGLAVLQRAVTRGYFVTTMLGAGAAFDPLRDVPAFQSLLNDAEAARVRALAAFKEAGGRKLLGSAGEQPD